MYIEKYVAPDAGEEALNGDTAEVTNCFIRTVPPRIFANAQFWKLYIEKHVTPDTGEEALTGDTAEVRLVVLGVSNPWTPTASPRAH